MNDYISFPSLGINFNIDPIAFNIGPKPIYWYGIVNATAFLVAILLALRNCKKHGIKEDDLVDLILIIIPSAIIGTRIFYVAFNWDYYGRNLSEVYKIWHGGNAIYGGLITGILAMYFFTKKRKMGFLRVLDFSCIYLLIGQIVGRWGNFFNQELFGKNTNLPWGMTGNRIQEAIIRGNVEGVNPMIPVHPVFLYEILWNIAALIVLLIYKNKERADGKIVSLYMMIYGLGRFWIEALRTDKLMIGAFRVNQLTALLFILVFGALFFTRKRIQIPAIQIDNEDKAEESEYSKVLEELKQKDDDA